MRREHPGWGPRRIEHQLGRLGTVPVPSRSAIYRCLKRHGLIELRRRRKRREDFQRWERERPTQLWQMDVMGGVMLEDGTELKAVTGEDDHSRCCIAAGLVRRSTSRPCARCSWLRCNATGCPTRPSPTTARFSRAGSVPIPPRSLFDRILREHGIAHRHTGIRSPTTTGKIERFHQSLRREFLDARAFASLEDAQVELDAWVGKYNTSRPLGLGDGHAGGQLPPRPARARRGLDPDRRRRGPSRRSMLERRWRPSYAPGELWTLMVAVRPRGRGTFGLAKGSPRQPRCYA
jgi:transposase InsO family protein